VSGVRSLPEGVRGGSSGEAFHVIDSGPRFVHSNWIKERAGEQVRMVRIASNVVVHGAGFGCDTGVLIEGVFFFFFFTLVTGP